MTGSPSPSSTYPSPISAYPDMHWRWRWNAALDARARRRTRRNNDNLCNAALSNKECAEQECDQCEFAKHRFVLSHIHRMKSHTNYTYLDVFGKEKINRSMRKNLFAFLSDEFIGALLKENIERGQTAVAFGDISLQLDFLSFGNIRGVDFLFKHAQIIPEGNDLLEENVYIYFFGLMHGIGGRDNEFPQPEFRRNGNVTLLRGKFFIQCVSECIECNIVYFFDVH
jgi:hypothetical protein